MAGNTFGSVFRLTTFGESHGKAIGGIIDGCPPGLKIDLEKIQLQLDRRRPGQSNISTQRKEEDQVEFLSGLLDSVTLGTPIGFIIKNKDQQSKDYSALKDVYRPSHADFVYDKKYGIRDHRGGGRSSARETACRVVAGALAEQLIPEMSIVAFVSQVGNVIFDDSSSSSSITRSIVDKNIVRCPDNAVSDNMISLIEELKSEGDSIGGVITCIIKGVPVGLGEPVFDKLNADLAKAMLSINAVKGFEIGSGFKAASMKGSEHNDSFNSDFKTNTNWSGGIQGGISNGEDIVLKVAFKPVATIAKKQETVDKKGNRVELEAKGRHDPCVVPRAVPIVESMAALVVADHLLRQRINGHI